MDSYLALQTQARNLVGRYQPSKKRHVQWPFNELVPALVTLFASTALRSLLRPKHA